MKHVTEVKAKSRFELWLRFDDVTAGTVDLSPLAGKGVFKAWDAPGAFERVRIGEAGQPEWDGAIDLCPDALYMEVTGKPPKDLCQVLKEESASCGRVS